MNAVLPQKYPFLLQIIFTFRSTVCISTHRSATRPMVWALNIPEHPNVQLTTCIYPSLPTPGVPLPEDGRGLSLEEAEWVAADRATCRETTPEMTSTRVSDFCFISTENPGHANMPTYVQTYARTHTQTHRRTHARTHAYTISQLDRKTNSYGHCFTSIASYLEVQTSVTSYPRWQINVGLSCKELT